MRNHSSFPRYHKSVSFIEELSTMKRASAYGAEAHPVLVRRRMNKFLALLDNPHRTMDSIHVTGTSGKGSTTIMIGGMLRAAGKRAGVYCSPHTTTTIERFIGPDGKLMSPNTFVKIVAELKSPLKRMDGEIEGIPSYLEIMAGIAFLFFRKERCDWIVLEVGMGGARDATNAIPPPRAAVITPIDRDHAHLIGPTLQDIAREKAAIIKQGTHVFTNEHRASLKNVIKDQCQRVGALLHIIPSDLPLHPSPTMNGMHQQRNAQLASAVGQFLELPSRVINSGITQARLPCRWEVLQHHPTVILDGAHNPLAIRAVAQECLLIPSQQRILVVGLSEHKDAHAMLRELPSARILILTYFVGSRASQSPGALSRILTKRRLSQRYQKIITALDADDALAIALKNARRHDTIMVTGSLYLTGSLRKRWMSEEMILQHRSSFRKK